MLRRSIGVLALFWSLERAVAQTDVASSMRHLEANGSLTIQGESICTAGPLREFYRRRGDQPAWNDANAAAMSGALKKTEDEGLDARPYHQDSIANTSGGARDILLTDAFLSYGVHLLQGRIDPQTLDSAWCIAPRALDLPAILQSALDDNTVAVSLERLSPRGDGYTKLRAALADYRRIAALGGWPAIDAGPPLRYGDRGPRVKQLAARLGRRADLFDNDLEERVCTFQAHHGLAADGIAGGATLRELNVTVDARIEQLAANMERWRWMPDDLSGPHLVVNIAAFQLKVIDRAQTVMTMRTIVGTLYDTRTPFFPAQIRSVVFNPYWNVPPRIAEKEIRPKQRHDPRYLARNHYEVSGGSIRQKPGPWNALGRVKFDMPNRFMVYLHDTPYRSLFKAETPAFSHGCIRVSEPRELAAWLLRDQPGWSRTAIDAAIATGREHVVTVTEPVPVYVLYWTAFVDNGDLQFRRDIYDQDSVLIAALHRSQSARSRLTSGE